MGNTTSETLEQSSTETDLWWTNGLENQPNAVQRPEVPEEISRIRQRRTELIEAKKKEMDELRKENEELKELLKQRAQRHNGSGNDEVENLQLQVKELQKQLEEAHSVFSAERQEYKNHVVALKDVIAVSKQLVIIRDEENKQLSAKVSEIQATLPEIELEKFSNDIRNEYERQLNNMKQLKNLYEEKHRADKAECNRLKRQCEETSVILNTQEEKNKELEERIAELEQSNSDKYDSIRSLESQLGLSKAECAEIRSEMAVVNQLFSQILLGFNNGPEVDLDNLIKQLEENHDLLTEIVVNEECAVMSSALPKVLLDLIHQVNEKNKLDNNVSEDTEEQNNFQQTTISSAAEIVENLPKVWRVLIELLSHQTTLKNENNEECDKNPCYKSVETPTGPTLVLSVSKTFIRLKDLIVQKKSLEKETSRLKQLNTHLEVRLQDQEKRLEKVSHELANTWHVVGKMQKQHQQLHTHEKILRYELSQKRKLLNELKEELEYCKEKCILAHEKNSSTEEQWKQLRSEFASRRVVIANDDVNNSMESGYSDDRESSSDDEYDDSTNPSILEVIQDEISKIECTSENTTEAEQSEECNPIIGDVGLTQLQAEVSTQNDASHTFQKLSEDVVHTILMTQCNSSCSAASTNSERDNVLVQNRVRTPEEILAGREERLQRLEEQAKQLVGKVQHNSNRGTEFCNALNKLHDKYGSTTEDRNEVLQGDSNRGNSS